MQLTGFDKIEQDLDEHYASAECALEETLLEFPSAADVTRTAFSSIEWISLYQAAQCRVGNWATRTRLKRMQVLQVIRITEKECQYTTAKPYLAVLNRHLTRLSDLEKALTSHQSLLGEALFSLKSIQSCATSRHLYEE